MSLLLRTGSVLAAMTLTAALPNTAEAQWFGWGWDWGWGPAYYEPAGAWTSYYPGSYAYGSYHAPGGCCAPACGCDPCCSPCGPCGSCGACGLGGCAGGNCAGGNCAYDAPANGAPIPDPNADAPPSRPRTNPSPRTRDSDDAPPFEAPMRRDDASSPDVEPLPRRSPRSNTPDPFDTTSPDESGASSRTFQDRSTSPSSGTRSRPGTTDDLLDPARDGSFGTQKPEVPGDETVIPQRTPAKTPDVDDGDTGIVGPSLDLKSTTRPVVQKARMASDLRRASSATRTAKAPVREWSAAATNLGVARK